MKDTKAAQPARAPYLAYLSLGAFLLVIGGVGYLAFLAFVKGVLAAEEFAAYGLVLVTLAAATASFFSPCSFSVLPSYIVFAGSPAGAKSPASRLRAAALSGGVAALGVVTVVIVLGAVIGVLGTGFGPSLAVVGPDPSPVSRSLRIGIGAFVGTMGLLHLLNLSHRVPLLGRISVWAIRAEGGPEHSLRSAYLYGAGYVAVGIG